MVYLIFKSSSSPKEVIIGKAAIGRKSSAPPIYVGEDQLEGALDDGAFISLHPPFERDFRVSAPEDRQSASADDYRNDQEALVVFAGPVNRHTDFACSR